MKYFSLIIFVSLFIGSVHATNPITDEDMLKKQNRQIIFKEIIDIKKTLEDFDKENGNIAVAEKHKYQEHLANLLKLYEVANEDSSLNTEEELYKVSQKKPLSHRFFTKR